MSSGGATVVVASATEEVGDVSGHLPGCPTWTVLRPGRSVAWVRVIDDPFARQLVADLRVGGISAVLGPPDEAHAVGWRNRNRPTVVSDRLTVCFPWAQTDGDGSTVVEIDPGAGFGTGDHPTTVLMLQELSERLEGGESVADIGCGSGVLAIAAARLGAHRADGIDINAAGLVAANRNASMNGVDHAAQFSETPVRELQGIYDAVVANIHAPLLASMADHLTRLVSPDGWLGLSGLSPAQVSVLVAAFPGFEFEAPRHRDDWTSLVGRRRS